LLPYLKASQPPSTEGPTLTLSVPRGYYYDYLVQRDHMQQIQDLAVRFFGRALRVSVNVTDVAESPRERPSADASPAALHAAALGDPVVKAAVEIFGGEVQEVRSRARREKGTQ
jgi:hypothetical protein